MVSLHDINFHPSPFDPITISEIHVWTQANPFLQFQILYSILGLMIISLSTLSISCPWKIHTDLYSYSNLCNPVYKLAFSKVPITAVKVTEPVGGVCLQFTKFFFREANGCLGMELYCNDEEGLINGSINEALVEREVLRVESMKRVSRASAKSTLMRPG